jgi:DNA-binding CsgD family transcriptional regulator
VDAPSTHREAHDDTTDGLARTNLDALAIGIEAIDALGTGIVALDLRACVLLANASAAELIARGNVFRLRPPRPLALRDPESNDALRKAIAAASRGLSTALQLRDVAARPVVNAVVLPRALPRSGCGRPYVLLAMNELVRLQAIPHRWLAQLFGLTCAEASVANWLVSGRAIDAYARHRGVSLETARSQLKAVLSKTGMSRQAQLVAALARLPVE